MPEVSRAVVPLPGRVDLAVVGGGILGAAAAHAAAVLRPGIRIAVLDQDVAGTATSRSLGVLAPWAATPGQRSLLQDGAAHLRDRVPAGLLAPFQRRLPVLVVASEETLERLSSASVGASMGPAPRGLVDRAGEAYGRLERAPGDRLATVEGGIGVQDASGLSQVLLSAEAGIRVLPGARVVHVDIAGAAERRLHLADGRALAARHVVLATGPWPIPELRGGTPEMPVPWRTKRVATLHAGRSLPEGAPLVCFPDEDMFLLPGADPRAGFWASFRCTDWHVAPGSGQPSEASRLLESGRSALARRVPEAAREFGSVRAAVDGYTVDGTPLVETLAPGVVRVGAGSGGGVRFAWGLAARVTRLLSGSDAATVPQL